MRNYRETRYSRSATALQSTTGSSAGLMSLASAYTCSSRRDDTRSNMRA